MRLKIKNRAEYTFLLPSEGTQPDRLLWFVIGKAAGQSDDRYGPRCVIHRTRTVVDRIVMRAHDYQFVGPALDISHHDVQVDLSYRYVKIDPQLVVREVLAYLIPHVIRHHEEGDVRITRIGPSFRERRRFEYRNEIILGTVGHVVKYYGGGPVFPCLEEKFRICRCSGCPTTGKPHDHRLTADPLIIAVVPPITYVHHLDIIEIITPVERSGITLDHEILDMLVADNGLCRIG